MFAIEQIEESTEKKLANEDISFSLSDLHPPTQQINVTAPGLEVQEQPLVNQEPYFALTEDDLIKMSRDAILQQRIVRNNCFQLQLSLEYHEKKKVIQLRPSPAEFIGSIVELLEDDLNSLQNIKCILLSKLEAVHSVTDGSQVFLPEDNYPREEISTIARLYKDMFQVPQSLAKASQAFTSLLAETTNHVKKQWQKVDMSVDDFREQVEDFKRKRKNIETLLFEDELMLGPFAVEVGTLKKKLIAKLDELTSKLFSVVTKKVMTQSMELESSVDKVLAVVEQKEWKNIEEVDEAKRFVLKIQDKYDQLSAIKREIQNKTDFLDANQSKMSEDQIGAMWQAFAKPQEIMYV